MTVLLAKTANKAPQAIKVQQDPKEIQVIKDQQDPKVTLVH